MQKFIAKYGLAAHLAILAVAPLFLYPFFDAGVQAVVLLWLSVPALIWIFMEPSLRQGESLHRARKRVWREIVADPLTWMAVILSVITGVRALNVGIGLSYDAEIHKWVVSKAMFTLLPGCVDGHGFLPFAAVVAWSVIMVGCRHSLGKSARMALLVISSSFSGVAAVMTIFLGVNGNAIAAKALECAPLMCSFVGSAFALYLLAGIPAVVAAFERGWALSMPCFVFAIGGNAAAAFAFCPIRNSVVFFVLALVLLIYSFGFSFSVLKNSGAFKMLVVAGISITLGGLLVAAVLPEKLVASRVGAVLSFSLLPESFMKLREMLSAIALRTWLNHLWIGTGLGSFPLDFRFGAVAENWAMVRGGVTELPNGWLFLLVERGIVGAVMLALPTGMLLFTYFRRMVGGFVARKLPHPACFMAPMVICGVALITVCDCSLLRGDILIAGSILISVSASSFSKAKRRNDG